MTEPATSPTPSPPPSPPPPPPPPTPSTPPPPAQFEISLSRKLESRSTSLLNTFRLLDIDKDGYITRSDLKTAIHNVWGIDLTKDQMDAIFARFAFFDHSPQKKKKTSEHGIRYVDFVDYISDTAAKRSSSEYGVGLDLHIQESNRLLVLAEGTLPKEILRTLKRKLQAIRLSKRGMKETSLFLMMDDDRSGKITPRQFKNWVAKVGLELSDEQCKAILGEHYKEEGIELKEFVEFVEGLEEVNGAPLQWEEHETKMISDEADKAAKSKLQEAVKICVDDAKTDQMIIRTIAEKLFAKRTSLLEAFRKFDYNGSGMLEPDDFWSALQEVGLDVSKERALSMFEKFDKDGDGKLNKSAFVMLISSGMGKEEDAKSTEEDAKSTEEKRQVLVRGLSGHEDEHHHKVIASRLDEEDIQAIMSFREALDEERLLTKQFFHKMDTKKSKDLGADELAAGFERLGLKVSKDHIRHIISNFDTDGSGKLKYFQFIKLLSATLNE